MPLVPVERKNYVKSHRKSTAPDQTKNITCKFWAKGKCKYDESEVCFFTITPILWMEGRWKPIKVQFVPSDTTRSDRAKHEKHKSHLKSIDSDQARTKTGDDDTFIDEPTMPASSQLPSSSSDFAKPEVLGHMENLVVQKYGQLWEDVIATLETGQELLAGEKAGLSDIAQILDPVEDMPASKMSEVCEKMNNAVESMENLAQGLSQALAELRARQNELMEELVGAGFHDEF